jgi:hypothetical protein
MSVSYSTLENPGQLLARGTKPSILSEVEVEVIVQLHLKHRHKNVTNPTTKAQKANTTICNKWAAVSKKRKWNCSQRNLFWS